LRHLALVSPDGPQQESGESRGKQVNSHSRYDVESLEINNKSPKYPGHDQANENGGEYRHDPAVRKEADRYCSESA
jgi:hypothetical protein